MALDGELNPVGSRLAVAAMAILALGLAPFWCAVAAALGGARRAAAVRRLGLGSAAATAGAVLLPSERFGAIHGAVVLAACVPGLAAAALAVHGLARAEPRPRVAAWLGGSMLVVAAADFALYAAHYFGHDNGTPLVPALEKVALLLLLGWMGAATVPRSVNAAAPLVRPTESRG